MCSSPKPKRKVKAKTANSSVGILSSMSSEKRLSFADRANQASDRRIEARQLKREEQQRINKLIVKKSHPLNIKAKTNTNQSWLYRVLNSPFSELMRRIVS
ncbi:hypothetical protein [Candidatus Colwellia aromaticivorans]|uniref:hypothetical protein n=1 Tax=Candidatus Colwellia aromaticivorans TaxID=2267621 RepID=UPI000DF3F0CA|nr:hypothetical protein [Candidatus Colwellia aromaticivorans]